MKKGEKKKGEESKRSELGFDYSLPWAPVFLRKLPNCHRYSVSITQRHLILVSNFQYSSLNLVRIE